MEQRITATDLVRTIGDVLSRVRYRGDRFLIERSGQPIARIVPVGASFGTVGEALQAWRAAAEPDSELAATLERVGRIDREPENPWDS